MLDSIRSVAKGWVGKALLALITIPFALFGIDSYLSQAGNNVAIAKVGNSEISLQDYSNALQNLRNRLQSEGKVDQAELDRPEVKIMVLNQLINQQLLDKEIKDANYAISDAQLATYITGMPTFQKDGKFSQELYDQLLQENRISPKKFEASIRADLLSQQAQDGITKLGFISNKRANDTLKLLNQKRVVSVAEIKTKDFVDQVKIEPAQVKAYYEQHKDKLRTPEQVKIEFLLLSASALVPTITVNDDEVKKFYDENAAKFQGDEQRRASHILIGFGTNATAEQKQAAKDKAEQLLAAIKKNPKLFEELATKNSQDPGSAAKGGDLGSFGRGAMVKPFEDAAFAMKVNQVSDLVESEFGYHIIKLTEISGQAAGDGEDEGNGGGQPDQGAASSKHYSEITQETKCIANFLALFQHLAYAYHNHRSANYTVNSIILIFKYVGNICNYFTPKLGRHTVRIHIKTTLARVLNTMCEKLSGESIFVDGQERELDLENFL
jgi:peptidyl-prolyl cis-trans isomerase D